MASLPLDIRRYAGRTPSSTTYDSSTFNSVPSSLQSFDSDVSSPFQPPSSSSIEGLMPFAPPPMPPPPRYPPPPQINPSRKLIVGDVIVPGEHGNDVQYRIRADLASTHFGRVYVADVLINAGTITTNQEVILKEFRVDRAVRLGRTLNERYDALLSVVTAEFNASLLVDARLRRPTSRRNGGWTDKTLLFLATLDQFTIFHPGDGEPSIFLVTNYIVGSVNLVNFLRETLYPMWRAGAVGRYWLLALTIAHSLAAGIAAMHAAGLAHRDVKAPNTVVYWDESSDARTVATWIIDFGHTCAFNDPLLLVRDPVEVDRDALYCDLPYASTRGYLDPAVALSRPDLGRAERFARTKAADVYATAQTIALMFDTTTTTFEPRRVHDPTVGSEITNVPPAAPPGMLGLLNAMTRPRLDERLSAAEVVVALERIIDHIDPTQTRAAMLASGVVPPQIEFQLMTDTSSLSM